MSNYTPIIENAQPVAHYNCNDLSGDIVDNVGALNFPDNSSITYQQTGALLGETTNKAILLAGILETPNTLDTSTFGTEFACEFWITPNTTFVLDIGASFKFTLDSNNNILLQNDTEISNKEVFSDNYSHIVLNYSSDTLGVYLNGNLYHISYQTPTFNANEFVKLQGDAIFDELAIYDRRLSEIEIQSHFNNAKQFDTVENNIASSQPIAYFPMSDNTEDMQSWHGNIKGKYHNSPTLEQLGKHDKSVLFDGVDQYAEIYNPSILDRSMVLLLHGNGANNSTTFVDESLAKQGIIVNGDVKVSTLQAKFKQSIYFDGIGDYLEIQNTQDFGFGLDDFTADCWIYLDGNVGTDRVIFDFRNTESSVGVFYIDDTDESLRFYGGIGISSVGSILNQNQWYHVAFEKHNGIMNTYLDGSLDATTATVADFTTSRRLGIGAIVYNGSEGTLPFNGYIDEIRIVKGIAMYQGNFTPMTTEYKSVSEPIPTTIGDGYFDKNVLLLHLEATDLSTQIRDMSNARVGVASAGGLTLSNAQSKFGNTSAYFDGVNDYINCEIEHVHRLTKYDFTIEMQIYKTAVHDGVDEALISMWGGAGSACEFWLLLSPTQIRLDYRGDDKVTYILSPQWNWIPTLNTWHHIALCKSDTTYTMYIDGVSLGDIVETTRMNAYNENVQIGVLGNGAGTNYWYHGYMDEIRITRGVARYTENFTPPTKPFEDRKLAYHDWDFGKSKDKYFLDTTFNVNYEGDNSSTAIYDHSNVKRSLTLYGQSNANNGQKKFGDKSMRFDGNGDYSRTDGVCDALAGKNNFVIEGWYRDNLAATSVSLWAINGSTGSINRFGLWTHTLSLTFGGNTGYSFDVPIITIANTWVHIAVVYDNGYLKIYQDGVSVLSKDAGNNTISTADTFVIGCEFDSNNAPGNYLQGNCDDFRVTIDKQRYHDNFEPPIRSNPIAYGQFEHTVECWFNMVAVTGGSFNTIFSKGTDTENALVIQDSVFSTTGTIQYFYNGSLAVTDTDVAIGLATWNHIAVTFEQYAITIFLNGSAIARLENIAPDITDKSFFIGSDSNNTYPSNAYISDFIIHDRALCGDEIFNRYNEFENVNTESATLYYDTLKKLGVRNYYKCDNKGDVFVDEFNDRNGVIYDQLPANKVASILPADSINKAYYVNGSYMRIKGNYETYTLPATISMRININQYSDDYTLWMLKGGGAAPEVDGSGIYDVTIFGLRTSVDATYPNELYFWSVTDGITHYLGFVPTLNQTYHLTLVMTTTNLKLYVDGILETTLTVTVSNIGKISTIGRDQTYSVGATEDYTVDEILAFTNKAFTPDEVYELYSASNLSLLETQDYYDYIDYLGPLHYYKFNDNSTTITDSIGSYDGILSGTGFNQSVDGYLKVDPTNKAIQFNNVGDVVTFDGSSTFSGDVTVSFFLQKINTDTTHRDYVKLGSSSIYGEGNNIKYWNGSTAITTSISMANNIIKHITLTTDGSVLNWYVNGVYLESDTLASNITGLLKISSTGYVSLFAMDELLVFNKILTDTEISTLYNKAEVLAFGTSIPDYDNLISTLAPIHYYKMNDLSSTIVDEIGTDNGSITLPNYQLQRKSLISDLTNKSIKLVESPIIWSTPINTSVGSHTFNMMVMFHDLPSELTSNTSVFAAANTSGFYVDKTSFDFAYFNSSTSVYSGFVVEKDVKYFITFVTTPTNVKIYINSKLILDSVFTHNFDDFNRVGKDPWAGNITVDELLIFDRELSISEIEQLYQSSSSTLDKNKSYEDFLFYSQPKNYYPLDETTTTIFDQTGDNGGILSGVSYTQQFNSMLFSNTNSKSTLFTNAAVTLDANASVIVRTLSFMVKVNTLPTTENISLISGPTKNLAYIDFPSNRLTYYDSTTRYSPFIFEAGKSYHIVVNYFNGYVEWYVDGKKLDIREVPENGITDTSLTADTINAIAENNGDVALDEIVVYTERNLKESEIYQVFELHKYDFELLTGYRIRGTTQIEGAYRSLDVRLYQHDTGGLLSSILSDVNGVYEFVGLQNIEYDLVFFEDGKYTTCQEIYMGVYPETYQY